MRKKLGFTLVELIIVISILAVLALIIVPSIIGYTAKAKETVALRNLKQIRMVTDITLDKLDMVGDNINLLYSSAQASLGSGESYKFINEFNTIDKTMDYKIGDLLNNVIINYVTDAQGGLSDYTITLCDNGVNDNNSCKVGKGYTYNVLESKVTVLSFKSSTTPDTIGTLALN